MKLIVGILILLVCIGTAVWVKLHGTFCPGNSRTYDLVHVKPDPASPLKGKTIFCLGSSVTAGLASGHVSFVDYMARIDGCSMIKAAASASTLADHDRRSYIQRLKRHPAFGQPIDCFLCQLSTNDATFHSELGKVSDLFEKESFDTRTTVGAIEALILLVKETWDCPVVFYTGTRYDNPRYHKLVNLLLDVAEKWKVEVIDMWHDPGMNKVSPEEYSLYMSDGVHPTKAGYLLWWTPVIQKHLYQIMQKQ